MDQEASPLPLMMTKGMMDHSPDPEMEIVASNPQLHSLVTEELKPSHLLDQEEHKLSLAWQLMMLLLPLLPEEEHSKAKLLLTLLN